MSNVRAETINIDLIFSPFPADAESAISIIASAEWLPEARFDIRAQTRTVNVVQHAGDPLQSALLTLQSGGRVLIENRFTMVDQDLNSNPLDGLTASWLFNAPTLNFPLRLRAVAQWRPAGFVTGRNRVRPQIAIEQTQVTNPTGGIGVALQTVSDFMLNALAATFAPTDTLLFGPFDEAVEGVAPPDITDLLSGADINDFLA